MAHKVRVTDGVQEWIATVDGSAVSIEGVDGTFTLTARPDGRWMIAHAGQRLSATAHPAESGVWTGIQGRASHWQVQPAASRARHAAVDTDVRSPMSATVVRMIAEVGSAVAEGDILLVVEAMKMEMPLRAPRAAVVRAVHCHEGELVQPTSILVELE